VKLGYVLLYVDDVKATVAFYERAFGLSQRFLHESGTYAELETGATALGIVDAGFAAAGGVAFHKVTPGAQAPGIEVGLVADDVNSAYATALAAGAVAVVAPHRKP
jgi:predicted enzyme related to lactoylglutathione lyase